MKTRFSVPILFILAIATTFSTGSSRAADALSPAPAPDSSLTTQSPYNQPPALTQPRDNAVLPADTAFALSALVEAENSIVLMWTIKPGYYLYRKSLMVETADGTPLTSLDLPAASDITDEFFGDVAVYYERLLLRIPLQDVQAGPGDTVELLLSYQGCAEDLYCYPPQQKVVAISLPE